ncbi:MAG TPA: nucleotide exchange factor GrpE, partial [Candidatus Binatus sp.]|nr:nucleotide exchange factor GrpE [Candidatus Binatus sp.]
MDPIDPFRRRPPRPIVHPSSHRTRAEERAAEIDISPARLAAEVERLTRERDAALRKARDAEAAAAAAASAASVPSPKGAKAADRAELEAAVKARDEYLAALQRERAEFLNFKRRTAEEREASLGLAAESLIRKVLALADDFDRAIESRPDGAATDPWVEGIAAIDRKLRQLLESEGVTAIEATRGMAFDPRDHEAVASVPGSGLPDGQVVEELRRGYRLRDRVIRPALVAVSQGAAGQAPGDGAVLDTAA